MKLPYTQRVNIKIINKKCLKCSHHKAWNKPTGIFCSYCGHEFTKEDLNIKTKDTRSIWKRLMDYGEEVYDRRHK